MNSSLDKVTLKETEFYLLSEKEIFEKLKTDKKGLSEEEAKARLDDFGKNKLPEKEGDSALKRFFQQFNNALIYILLGASVLTAVMD